MPNSKITTGTNDRPKDETIAQSGEGLPGDSGKLVDIDDEGSVRFEQILRGMGGTMPSDAEIPDEAMDEANNAADELEAGTVDVEGTPRQKLEKEVQEKIEPPLKGSA